MRPSSRLRGARFAIVAACLLGLVALPGCAPSTSAERDVTAAPDGDLLPAANGIAFIRGGRAYVVSDGSKREVLRDGRAKVAVTYSADRKNLLVTEELGARRVVVKVPAGSPGPGSVVLDSAEASLLGTVRASASPARVYYSVFGDPATTLLFAEPDPGSRVSTVPLGSTFSGEFDVDATGETLVYTGSGQNPATVTIREGAVERPLVAGLATAFSPAISPDGTRVCFTGNARTDTAISVWVMDADSSEAQALSGTEALTPAYPVFSPDGSNIACRAEDGAIWLVSSRGGEPRRLGVSCDDAAIAW